MHRSPANRYRLIRLLGPMLMLLLAALVLSACNDPAPTPTPTPTDVATPEPPSIVSGVGAGTPTPDPTEGNVVLWHSWAGSDADALNEILIDFRGRYPNLRVDTLFVAYDDLPLAYVDAVQAGQGPDLVIMPNWWIGDLVSTGAIAPLHDVVSPDQIAGYWPATLENMSWDGVLYGLPTTYELVSLYANRRLVPPQAFPKTTDEMLALAGQAPEFGTGLYASLYHLFWGIPSHGSQLLDPDGRVVLDQTDGTADFLTWLTAMDQVQGSYVSTDYSMLLDRFKKAEFAFLVDGPWARAELKQALGDDLVMARLPAGPVADAQPWLSADGVFLNPNPDTMQQGKAALLAQHLTGADGGTTWAQVAGRLPAHREADPGVDPIMVGFMNQAATARSMPSVPEMDEVWGYGGDMLLKVLNDVSDPQSAVREASALINEANGK